MTKAGCRRLVRKVSDGRATLDELELVVGVIIEEMLLRDYDGAVAKLREIIDAPTIN